MSFFSNSLCEISYLTRKCDESSSKHRRHEQSSVDMPNGSTQSSNSKFDTTIEIDKYLQEKSRRIETEGEILRLRKSLTKTEVSNKLAIEQLQSANADLETNYGSKIFNQETLLVDVDRKLQMVEEHNSKLLKQHKDSENKSSLLQSKCDGLQFSRDQLECDIKLSESARLQLEERNSFLEEENQELINVCDKLRNKYKIAQKHMSVAEQGRAKVIRLESAVDALEGSNSAEKCKSDYYQRRINDLEAENKKMKTCLDDRVNPYLYKEEFSILQRENEQNCIKIEELLSKVTEYEVCYMKFSSMKRFYPDFEPDALIEKLMESATEIEILKSANEEFHREISDWRTRLQMQEERSEAITRELIEKQDECASLIPANRNLKSLVHDLKRRLSEAGATDIFEAAKGPMKNHLPTSGKNLMGHESCIALQYDDNPASIAIKKRLAEYNNLENRNAELLQEVDRLKDVISHLRRNSSVGGIDTLDISPVDNRFELQNRVDDLSQKLTQLESANSKLKQMSQRLAKDISSVCKNVLGFNISLSHLDYWKIKSIYDDSGEYFSVRMPPATPSVGSDCGNNVKAQLLENDYLRQHDALFDHCVKQFDSYPYFFAKLQEKLFDNIVKANT